MKYKILKIIDSEGQIGWSDLLNQFVHKDPTKARHMLEGLVSAGLVKESDKLYSLTYLGIEYFDRQKELKFDRRMTRILSCAAVVASIISIVLQIS